MTLEETLTPLLEGLTSRGLRRTLVTLESPGSRQEIGGRSVISFASNDYLGLGEGENTTLKAEHGEPLGALASRLVVGNLAIHDELEAALASFVGLPAALLFTSGFAANVGVIPALVGAGDVIFSDQLNHASLIDGARLSGARIVVYPHNDMDALSSLLKTQRGAGRAIIVSEAVFSMDGDGADLQQLAVLSKASDSWLYIDEAHSLGLLGQEGAGLCAALGVKPDVLLGTLGKSFASQGAFVAGSAVLRDWLIHRARSFVFSTGLSPYVSRETLWRIPLVREAQSAREKALALASQLRDGLRSKGFDVRGGGAAITSVVLGEPEKALAVSKQLLELGFLIRAIRPPTVPAGTSRVRIVTTAAHTSGDVERLIAAFGVPCS